MPSRGPHDAPGALPPFSVVYGDLLTNVWTANVVYCRFAPILSGAHMTEKGWLVRHYVFHVSHCSLSAHLIIVLVLLCRRVPLLAEIGGTECCLFLIRAGHSE